MVQRTKWQPNAKANEWHSVYIWNIRTTFLCFYTSLHCCCVLPFLLTGFLSPSPLCYFGFRPFWDVNKDQVKKRIIRQRQHNQPSPTTTTSTSTSTSMFLFFKPPEKLLFRLDVNIYIRINSTHSHAHINMFQWFATTGSYHTFFPVQYFYHFS